LLAHGVRLNYANETFIMQEPEIVHTLTANMTGANGGPDDNSAASRHIITQLAQSPTTGDPDIAGTLGGRIGGRLDIDTAGAYVIGEAQAFSGAHGGETELAATLLANRRMDYETETFVTQEPIGFSHTQGLHHQASSEVFPTLRAQGGGHAVMHEATNDDVKLPALVRMREGKPGGGKGPLISEQSSLTLATGNDQVLFQEKNTTSATGTVTHSLTASSSKGTTEDGTGRGVPIVSQETAVWPELIGTLTTAFDGKNYSNIQEVLSGSVVLSEGPSEDD
jgi:hypothetical protein